jgi:hypothetical protein
MKAWNITGLGAALGCAAVVAAGCSSGDQQIADGPQGAGLQLSKPTAVAPAGEKPATAKTRDATARAHARPQSFSVSPLAQTEERAVAVLQDLRVAEARQERMNAHRHTRVAISAVRDLTNAVLVSVGLEFATFDVINGGKAVTINVPNKDACALSAGDATHISDRIIDGSSIIEHVTLRLTSGVALPAYLKAYCRTTAAPAGLGPVLLSVADNGTMETAAFHAQRAGWTIDWTSYSGVLQIYIYRNHKLVSVAANQSGRGAGQKKSLTAGTYTLQIAGTGDWKVKVRDGAAPQPATVSPQGQPTTAP